MKLSREHVQDLTRTPLHQGLKIFSFQAESLWSVSAASLTFLFPSVFTIVILFWLHHCVLSEREVSECVCVCVCVFSAEELKEESSIWVTKSLGSELTLLS